MSNETLIPCPHCGSEDILHFPRAIGIDARIVQCQGCGAHTPLAVWNQRAPAPAAPLGPAFDFLQHLARQAAWSEKTFGPGSRAKGVVDHIRKELREIEAEPGDLKEWIDVVILALDGAWRSGAKPDEIISAIAAKQAKNEARTWPDWRTMDPNKAIEHDRTGEEPAPQPIEKTEQLAPQAAPADYELPPIGQPQHLCRECRRPTEVERRGDFILYQCHPCKRLWHSDAPPLSDSAIGDEEETADMHMQWASDGDDLEASFNKLHAYALRLEARLAAPAREPAALDIREAVAGQLFATYNDNPEVRFADLLGPYREKWFEDADQVLGLISKRKDPLNGSGETPSPTAPRSEIRETIARAAVWMDRFLEDDRCWESTDSTWRIIGRDHLKRELAAVRSLLTSLGESVSPANRPNPSPSPVVPPVDETYPIFLVDRLRICEGCLKGLGEMCHTPGCALIRSRSPDLDVRESIVFNGGTITPETTPAPKEDNTHG